MKIQQIKPADSCKNNTYRARFINDSNGYLRKLWDIEFKDSSLENQINRFAEHQIGHDIEILGPLGAPDENLQKDISEGFYFFNHRTGAIGTFRKNEDGYCRTLSNFFKQLFDTNLFDYIFYEKSLDAKMWKKLTGK